MQREVPHVFLDYCRQTPVEEGLLNHRGVVYEEKAGYHALFAAKIVPEPYGVIKQRKLGWADRDLLDEVLDRQGRFIASLHYIDPRSASPDPYLRTVALRYISTPDHPHLSVILVGKVFAPEREQAHTLALEWYWDISALFSSDYQLLPFASEEEFTLQSGQQLLGSISSSAQTAEARRFEMFLPRPLNRDIRETHYLVFPFAWHRNGMEQVWQVLASQSAPMLVSVVLRPAYLYEAEEFHLARLYEMGKTLAESERIIDRILGEQTAQIYADYLRSWRQPFLVRVQIVAPQGIPGALARAVGCALSYGTLKSDDRAGLPFPGYELVEPGEDEFETAQQNACLLEMGHWGPDQAALPYRRFRYLTDLRGAQCAFRLPFIPMGGIPGVLFETAVSAASS
jgi:hypothetical protein